MTKKQITDAIKILKSHEKAIAKERDLLDATMNKLVELKECCEEAVYNLESARDALSQLV